MQDIAHVRTFMDSKFFGSWTCARYAAPGPVNGSEQSTVSSQAAGRIADVRGAPGPRRLGRAGDVAGGVLFLESSPYITGEILHIDGGQAAGH